MEAKGHQMTLESWYRTGHQETSLRFRKTCTDLYSGNIYYYSFAVHRYFQRTLQKYSFLDVFFWIFQSSFRLKTFFQIQSFLFRVCTFGRIQISIVTISFSFFIFGQNKNAANMPVCWRFESSVRQGAPETRCLLLLFLASGKCFAILDRYLPS